MIDVTLYERHSVQHTLMTLIACTLSTYSSTSTINGSIYSAIQNLLVHHRRKAPRLIYHRFFHHVNHTVTRFLICATINALLLISQRSVTHDSLLALVLLALGNWYDLIVMIRNSAIYWLWLFWLSAIGTISS